MLNTMRTFTKSLDTSFLILWLGENSCCFVVQSRRMSLSNQRKSMLTSSCLLTHDDPGKPLILACNALPYKVEYTVISSGRRCSFSCFCLTISEKQKVVKVKHFIFTSVCLNLLSPSGQTITTSAERTERIVYRDICRVRLWSYQ